METAGLQTHDKLNHVFKWCVYYQLMYKGQGKHPWHAQGLCKPMTAIIAQVLTISIIKVGVYLWSDTHSQSDIPFNH